jgi:hypothetical protein
LRPHKNINLNFKETMTMASTWRLRDVAQAIEMNPRALRQCFETGALKLDGRDKKSTGSGSYIGLSKQRAYQAAIMKHLNRIGLSIPDAARAAYEFSDVGNIDRAPGYLFAVGKTMLLAKPDGATVINVFSHTTHVSNGSVFICVDINSVVDQVDAALNKII